MSEMQEKKNIQDTSPPQRTERELPLDTQLLSEAVIELNISRKNGNPHLDSISKVEAL